MAISAVGFGGDNEWMKKKLLERQAQKGMQPQGQEVHSPQVKDNHSVHTGRDVGSIQNVSGTENTNFAGLNKVNDTKEAMAGSMGHVPMSGENNAHMHGTAGQEQLAELMKYKIKQGLV